MTNPIEIRVTVNAKSKSLRINEAMILGNTYHVTFENVYGECGFFMVDCDGKTVAATDGAGVLSLATEECIGLFPKENKCPCEAFVHAYVTQDGNTIASGDAVVRYSPISFTPTGMPVTMKGDTGKTGDRGKSAYEVWLETTPGGTVEQFIDSLRGPMGQDGRDASIIDHEGLFSFQVSMDDLIMYAQDKNTLYACNDETKPRWSIDDAGNLIYTFYNEETGESLHSLNLGKVKGDTGEQGKPGEKGETGAPGADGTSEERVKEIANAAMQTLADQVDEALLDKADKAVVESTYAKKADVSEVEKVVDGKQDKLNFDNAPTAKSENPVHSGGLFSTFQQMEARIASLRAEIENAKARIAAVFSFRGNVASKAELPTENVSVGDVWHANDTGAEWAWNGTAWEELGTAVDLSGYATIEDLREVYGTASHGLNTAIEASGVANDANRIISYHVSDTDNPHSVTEAQVASVSTGEEKKFGRLDSENAWLKNQSFKNSKGATVGLIYTDANKVAYSSTSNGLFVGISGANHINFNKGEGAIQFCTEYGKPTVTFINKNSFTVGIPLKANKGVVVSGTTNLYDTTNLYGDVYVSGNLTASAGASFRKYVEFGSPRDISVVTDEAGVNYLNKEFGFDSLYNCDISSFAKSDGGIVNMVIDPSSYPEGYNIPSYGFIESTYHITNMTGEYDCTFSLDTNRISDVPETSIKFVYGGDTSIYENIPVGGILVFTIRMTQLWITETDSPAYFVFVKNQGVFSI